MRVIAVVVILFALVTTAEAKDKRPAKKKQTATAESAKTSAKKPKKIDRSIGAPWSGRLQSAVKFDPGDGYLLRRPQRTYATKTTVAFMRQAITDVLETYPKAHTLAIGDFSQQSGGWISEHASHQSGRDVDIGLFFKKKPKGYPDAFIKATKDTLDAAATWRLVSLLARTQDEDGGVQMIFLDEALQDALFTWADKHDISDKRIKEAKRVLRHIPHHADHMHVRFKCRERDTSCR